MPAGSSYSASELVNKLFHDDGLFISIILDEEALPKISVELVKLMKYEFNIRTGKHLDIEDTT